MTSDVDATLGQLDQIRADRERHTRTDLLDAGVPIDVDAMDAVFEASAAEWADARARLRAAVLAAFAGDLTLLDALGARPRPRAEDDRPCGPAWQRL